MPKLNQRTTKTIKLQTVEGGEVICYTSYTAGDVEKLSSKPNEGETRSDIAFPLSLIIKAWNLVDDDDQPLPVNQETIMMLDIRDTTAITQEITVSLTTFLVVTPTDIGLNVKS